MNELALFAGAGGGILAGQSLGWRTVCAVERDAYAASILAQRQNDGVLEPFPIWSDVASFAGRPWAGCVDVISAGFPCQDISAAGGGAGIDGEKSGLWVEVVRIADEVRPRYLFLENSPMLTSRGLGKVLGDLATLGYDAQWGVLGAADVGAPHQRDRIWIVAHAGGRCSSRNEHNEDRAGRDAAQSCVGAVSDNNSQGQLQPQRSQRNIRGRARDFCEEISDLSVSGLERDERAKSERRGNGFTECGWWQSEPNVGRVADGVANRVDRIRCLGNGQVPLCAATAWRLLTERMNGQ